MTLHCNSVGRSASTLSDTSQSESMSPASLKRWLRDQNVPNQLRYPQLVRVPVPKLEVHEDLLQRRSRPQLSSETESTRGVVASYRALFGYHIGLLERMSYESDSESPTRRLHFIPFPSMCPTSLSDSGISIFFFFLFNT